MIHEAVEIARHGKTDAVRLKAIEIVLNRGYGKSGAVKEDTTPNALDHMTREERIKALENAIIEEKLAAAQEN